MGKKSKVKTPAPQASSKPKKINPFDLKYNRNKQNVLGAKKSIAGTPGLSKKRAMDIRKQNLGAELNRFGKSNVIRDKRLGERDLTLTEEQKAELRFKVQKEKFFKKKASKYNLEEGIHEDLTHKGAKLTNIQKFEKMDMSDEEGDLDPTLLADSNFGGSAFENVNEIPLGERVKTRREILNEVIAKSKQLKYEKQKEKEAWADETKKLDSMLNDLRNAGQLKGLVMRKSTDEEQPKQSIEDSEYDYLFKSLKLDCGKMAVAEKGIKLNPERKRKVSVVVEDDEDLKKKKDDEFELRFDEHGKVVNLPKDEKYSITKIRTGSDTESEDSDDCDDDDIDDILNSENEDNDDTEINDDQLDEEENITDEEEIEDEENTSSEVDESDEEETINDKDIVSSYEELVNELEKVSSTKTVLEYIEELCETYHPSKKQGNKEKLGKLFVFLLRHFDKTFKEIEDESTINSLSIHIRALYKLVKFDPDFALHCVRSLLKQKFKTRHQKDLTGPITFDIIAFYKLIPCIFRTDSYLHLISTPATLVFMDILNTCHIKNSIDAAKTSFFITLYVTSFERNDFFCPEIIAHLKGLLMMCVQNKENETFPTLQFPLIYPYRTALYISKSYKDANIKPLSISKLFGNIYNEDDVGVTLSTITAIIKNLQFFTTAYTKYSCSFVATFEPFLKLLKKMPLENYPESLEKLCRDTIQLIENEIIKNSSVKRLSKPQTEIKMLKMLEPDFDEDFNPERKKIKKDAASQNKQLKQKLRKETKGAIKELRKDAQFIAQKRRADLDAINQERIQKTATIIRQLQGQESEGRQRFYNK
ncbi:Nucleolar protein 14 [Strongyloides ratti]|uniref:Nucleolar protein 14 n=1 Tax=Strongyloides ratti TaxID=34506 RepID=A0A090LA37_STRRB|nr:Nucleolar protein 14 [Strongyloides ratti]CEF64375.1 Nucleolar protein 14 [Strongyloides ratti]